MFDDNLDRDSLESFDAEGVVTLRAVPQMMRPPSSYALVDPNQKLSLLQIVIKRPPGAFMVAGEWTRLKVWMWGVWHDRASESIQKGDTVRVVGGLLETDPDAQPGEYGFRLVLPPRGAAADTPLHITGPRGPDHTFEATITENRVRAERRGARPSGRFRFRRLQVFACRSAEKGMRFNREKRESESCASEG